MGAVVALGGEDGRALAQQLPCRLYAISDRFEQRRDARITVSGNLTKLTRDPEGAAVSQIRDSTKRWFVTDQIGSTTALVESNGTLSRNYDYDIDGNATTTSHTTGPETWIKYAGGHDVGGGLYHFGARYYQPSSARWTQIDPLQQPTDLGQANRYSYVGGNPANGVDPSGLSFIGNVKKIGKHVVTTAATYAGIGAAFGATGGCIFGGSLGGPAGCLASGETAGFYGTVGGTAIGTAKAFSDVIRDPSKYRGD